MENNELYGRVEAYFAALAAPLEELPATRRKEFVAEARSHVSAIVEARRADGLSEEAAWNAAMNEFGEPSEVGRAVAKRLESSRQLKGEGKPSVLRYARKFAPPIAGGIVANVFFLLLFLLDTSWSMPLVATIGVLSFGVGAYGSWRQSRVRHHSPKQTEGFDGR